MLYPKRILLADDDPVGVELVLASLAQIHLAGLVEAVGDGESALDYLYRRGAFCDRTGGDPSFILLDLKMPKVSGLEVLRQIKSDAQLRRVPVVVLTCSREASDIAASYDLGANTYVVKPVSFVGFMEAVKRIGEFWWLLNETPGGRWHWNN